MYKLFENLQFLRKKIKEIEKIIKNYTEEAEKNIDAFFSYGNNSNI